MKKKHFYLVMLVGILALNFMGCVSTVDTHSAPVNTSLDGDWDRGDIIVTISGNKGVFSKINTNYNRNPGRKVGDQRFRNITKVDDLKWSAQESFTGDNWRNSIIIMSADDRTIRVSNQGYPDDIYTRVK